MKLLLILQIYVIYKQIDIDNKDQHMAKYTFSFSLYQHEISIIRFCNDWRTDV